MKRRVLFLFSIIGLLIIHSCNYNCDNKKQPHCTDQVPTNEACQAAFQRWFYNSSTNQCEQKSYSGCSQKGFATQSECESCKCH